MNSDLLSNRTASTAENQTNEYLNSIHSQILTYIANSQTNDLSNLLSSLNIPPDFLTQYFSELIKSKKSPELVDLFLSKGANPNAIIHYSGMQIEDKDGITLLMFSIITNNLELFDIVLNYHPNILITDNNKKNALVYSILFNEDDNGLILLKLLSENNKAIHSTFIIDNEKHNLLTFAALKNKTNLVDILLKTDIEINYQTIPGLETALHIAVKNDNVEIAELINKREKFNKELKNIDGKTAKMMAKENKGKVYYKIFSKELEISSNNTNKENIQVNFNKQSLYNNNPYEMFPHQQKQKINKVSHSNSIEIPIEFVNDKFNSVLNIMENSSKLCININQSQKELNEEIAKVRKALEEKQKAIENYEEILNKKKTNINALKNAIDSKESEIAKYLHSTNQQKQIENSLENQIWDLKNAIQHQKDPPNQMSFYSNKFGNISYNENYITKCLQKDLTDYQAYIHEIISHKKPTIEEVLKNIQSAVNELNSEYEVCLYGSYSTGLCLPWSDIDCVLVPRGGHHMDEFLLRKLYVKLTSKPWVKSYKFIENTIVPIIKLVSNDKFNFHIDISIENGRHFGLKCVELVKSYLSTYSVLEPIILALKTLLNNGNLNNPYTGGLSSYGLILMVVSFIQSEIDYKKFNKDSPTILGETFLNVLGHYGIFFDFTKYVIVTFPTNKETIEKDKEYLFAYGQNMHEFIIVDPLNKQNNVAKSTFQFMNIKMAFMIAYMVAKEDCECGCHYEILSNKALDTDHCILKRIFNSVKRFSDANKNIY